MKRSISTTTLLLTSVSAIIGSGWLFAAFYTAQLAGPATILSWLIGGLSTIFIAFVFAEVSAMLPITGSSSRIPHYTHGTIVSFLFAWLIWLVYAALVPTEVQAVVQYLNFYVPGMTNAIGGLTRNGYIIAIALMLAVSTLNVFSMRWLLRCNNALTLFKLIIPIFISLAILITAFAKGHSLVPAQSTFMPLGWHGVFAAIASGGIVFAFNGFKLACELAGETKDPKHSLPIAIIGSVILCLAIYLLLQFAFLAALDHTNLVSGWHDLYLEKAHSPLAAVSKQLNLAWLLPIICIGSIIGPLASGLIYAGSASRSLYGTSKNGYLPLCFEKLTAHGNPIYAIVANFIFGILMFAPLPGWKNMVSFLTSLMAVTYAITPIGLLALREQVPHLARPFKLPMAKSLATCAFYFCTLFVYWSGWIIISKLSIALLVGFALLFTYHFTTERGRRVEFHWRASAWVWPYFAGLTFISYYGNFGGGLGILPFGWDFVVIAIFCIAIMIIALKYKLPAAVTQQFISELDLNH